MCRLELETGVYWRDERIIAALKYSDLQKASVKLFNIMGRYWITVSASIPTHQVDDV